MRSILFRILYLFYRALRPHSRRGLAASPKKILLLQYAMPLGCCVHGTPLYGALKAANPSLKIIVATRGLGLEALEHDPNVDFLLETSDPGESFSSLRRVAHEIRSQLKQQSIAPDLVLQDASNRKGSLALLAAMLHLAPSAGFASAPQLYDRHLDYDPNSSLIDNNLRLAIDAPNREPAVYFTQFDLDHARSLLPGDSSTIAFVMQGSGGQNTGWHDDRFAEVISHVENLGHRIIFLGTAQDAEGIKRIRALASSFGRSLAGQTTVPELAAVLSLTDLLITLDTGTMHVGRAVDVPMLVLGPSWQKPLEWLPLGKSNVRILRGPDRTDVPANYRLDEISTTAVIAAVDDLLAQFPPTSAAREARTAQRLSSTRI
jgi:ADP-heptose:LPS heptosyltransferase